MTATAYAHIDFKPSGAPIIIGMRLRVDVIVANYIDGVRTPAEIAANYPPLTLAQIHAALTYSYDHQEEMDRQMAEDDRSYAELSAQQPVTREGLLGSASPQGGHPRDRTRSRSHQPGQGSGDNHSRLAPPQKNVCRRDSCTPPDPQLRSRHQGVADYGKGLRARGDCEHRPLPAIVSNPIRRKPKPHPRTG